MIISREKSHPQLVQRAIKSAQAQTWTNTDLVRVINNDRQASIGTCFNAAVKTSTADYCLFMGDDDMIRPELAQFLIDFHLRTKRVVGEKYVASSCYMTWHNLKENTSGLMPSTFQGFYERSFLLKNPYKTSLKNNVDTEHIERLFRSGYQMGACEHYFGYQYTIHQDMVSGKERFKEKQKVLSKIKQYGQGAR